MTRSQISINSQYVISHSAGFLRLIVFSFMLCAAGCATVYNPATQRQEHILIDSAQEVQIGRGMAENIVKEGLSPLNDPARQLMVNRIGQRLVRVCDRQDIVYHFMILDSPDLNAFALPGGYVYVYSGLVDKVDESGLAAVLAHEIGHVAAKHSVKKMQSALGYELLAAVALAGFGSRSPQIAQEFAGLSKTVFGLLSRGYGRQDELFADGLAVKYLRLAQYDPNGLVKVLEILQKESGPGGRVFEILSDHPRMDERIRKAKEAIVAGDK